ncbi:class I SAM-dependent methyltransferase [Pseudoalteromonas xiamenensis]
MKSAPFFIATLLVSSLTASANPLSITNAVQNPNRTAQDVARDAGRKPADILAIVDVKADMKVVDYLAGGGYYTELFARLLNNSGTVFSVKGKLESRNLSEFKNIKPLTSLELDDLEGPVDRIFTALNYHDLVNKANLDRQTLLKSMHQKLSDDGYLIIIDHNAGPGMGISQTKKLHRVENSFVLNEVLKAGFELDMSSSVLANAKDDYRLDVWQPTTKGNTDRFVYRFKKRTL